jgi:hypothetical protein
VGPIDYSIDVANPLDSALSGYQAGLSINQFQQAKASQAAEAIQRQQQQEQQNQVIQGLLSKPNASADDYSKAMLIVPGLHEQLKQAWTTKSTAQQQSQLSDLAQWGAAIQSKQPEIAVDLMNRRADSMDNTNGQPTPESQALRAQAEALKAHPEFGNFMIKALLASHKDGKAVIDGINSQSAEQRAADQAPAELRKKTADAREAEAKATVASATVPQQIAKVDSELLTAEQKRRLDQFEAEIKGADSETKRGQLTLERDKFVAEQGLKTQAVAADSQNQLDTIGNSIATVKSLRDDPLIGEWLGVGSTLGPFLSKIPGSRTKDFRAKVDTLKSQQFLTAAKEMKGMGALSDAEGARIERAVASLDPDQSPGAFKNALGIIQTTLERGEAKLRANGKVPTAGGAFVMKHPMYGNVTEGDINRIVASRPGSTRQQAIDFLKSTGGQ